jgi:hypothetical protein
MSRQGLTDNGNPNYSDGKKATTDAHITLCRAVDNYYNLTWLEVNEQKRTCPYYPIRKAATGQVHLYRLGGMKRKFSTVCHMDSYLRDAVAVGAMQFQMIAAKIAQFVGSTAQQAKTLNR